MSSSDLAQHQEIEALYSSHHGWLHRWLQGKLGCAYHAADVAQDTFVRIISSRDALLGIEQPRAYLTTIAKRLLIDRSRRQLIEQAYLAEIALIADTLPGYPSPEDIAMAVQALAQIAEALEGAPARVRKAFLRHYLDDQTQAAIAVEMGVSKRMVQKYLVQALLHCRARCAALADHPV